MKVPLQCDSNWKSKFDYNFNQHMKHETNQKLTNSSLVALKNLGKMKQLQSNKHVKYGYLHILLSVS